MCRLIIGALTMTNPHLIIPAPVNKVNKVNKSKPENNANFKVIPINASMQMLVT